MTIDPTPEPIETPLAVTLPPPQTLALVQGDSAAAVIARVSEIATALRQVIEKQGLVSTISGKKYPRAEAWTLAGTLLGATGGVAVFPVLVWSRPLEAGDGWEARVEARTLSGAIVGAAEAQCDRSERNWSKRDEFALRSMAQTRATAKALRMPLGFIMTLAGYEPTPAEEMTGQRHSKTAPEASESDFDHAKPIEAPKTPRDAPEDDSVRPEGGFGCDCTVVEVKEATGLKKDGKAWLRFGVVLNDGASEMTCGTFSRTLGDLARQLAGTERHCWCEIVPGKKDGTWDLASLRPISEQDNQQEGDPK